MVCHTQTHELLNYSPCYPACCYGHVDLVANTGVSSSEMTLLHLAPQYLCLTYSQKGNSIPTVPAVGFQLVESAINESYPDKFACVEIKFSLGPLDSDIEIEFYTQDGSAQGT